MGFVKSRGLFIHRVSIDKDLCINCRRCVKACPRSQEVFGSEKKDETEDKKNPIALKKPERCGACLECQNVCPVNAIAITTTRKLIE